MAESHFLVWLVLLIIIFTYLVGGYYVISEKQTDVWYKSIPKSITEWTFNTIKGIIGTKQEGIVVNNNTIVTQEQKANIQMGG